MSRDRLHTIRRGTRYVAARIRGRTTAYFYGASLKEIRKHLKDGETFAYAPLKLGPTKLGYFTGSRFVEESTGKRVRA
jgi:hypothetical protein